MPLREQALVDDVVEQRGFAGTGDAAQADQPLERQTEVEAGDVVLGGAAEFQPGGSARVLIGYRDLSSTKTTGRREAGRATCRRPER